MPERIMLEYAMPVTVTVNLSTREVEQVLMLDQVLQVTDRCYDATGEPLGKVEPTVIERAVEIAEQADWPFWEWGK